ncbi:MULTISPECIES: sugar kinase [unclassified Arcicella]|uniref:sugar kinase n=1 Tax=unclassified Arcicella TaxID=2644986 RepID=UPI002866D876|nr:MULTISPECIES: sugar kinase [unclassified Arcicella]MDR6561315.1 2-dehydro-3-deoxygluconokinase [Arcicella sp. BE51]MDR6811199.1 2-dehydro-3-deoxygluconokinase [Arcicella sp. BE140]MDR6822549.1 2-dehydro-3-deoxygluconokinase [Arcicella sp. BE139]
MKKVVTFGEIMMRLSTPRHTRFQQATSFDINFGGGEANVSSSLAIMGVPASHVTRFPDNDLGNAAINTYRRYGLSMDDVVKGGDRIGIYYVEQGAAMRPSKVIYDRADSAFATLKPSEFNWEHIFEDAQWFHFTGITPAISESAAQACLEAAQTASRLGLKVSADVGYRSNLWKWGKRPNEIMPELIENCDVIICSKGDAEDMFGIVPNDDKRSFKSVCQQLTDRFPKLKKVLTTKRGQISASHNTLTGKCWNGFEMLETKQINIPDIVDRIGGGDAFMAGFIFGEIIYQNTQKAIEFGVAASALKHTIEGDFNLSSVSEIEAVMNGDVSGKLRR